MDGRNKLMRKGYLESWGLKNKQLFKEGRGEICQDGTSNSHFCLPSRPHCPWCFYHWLNSRQLPSAPGSNKSRKRTAEASKPAPLCTLHYCLKVFDPWPSPFLACWNASNSLGTARLFSWQMPTHNESSILATKPGHCLLRERGFQIKRTLITNFVDQVKSACS